MLARYPSRDYGRFEHDEPNSPTLPLKSSSRNNSFQENTGGQDSEEPSRLAEMSEIVVSITKERTEMRRHLAELEGKLAKAVQNMQKEKYSNMERSKSPGWDDTGPMYVTKEPSFSEKEKKQESKRAYGTKKSNSFQETKEEAAAAAKTQRRTSFNSEKKVLKEEKLPSRRMSKDNKKSQSDGKLDNPRAMRRGSSSTSLQINTKHLSNSSSSLSDGSDDDEEDTIGPMQHNTNKRRSSFSSVRDRIFSFSVDGMTVAEVEKEVKQSTSSFQRSEDSVDHKIVSIRREPQLLEEPHEETFFELFYDLILVVVFIKLSYLKYEMTFDGILTVAAIFSNFWSCWSLMNCYATMLHTEDMVHRFYYVAHITASFIMAITIEHPNHSFFSYNKMAMNHAAASILCRCMTLFMWCYAYQNKLENTRRGESLLDYTQDHIRRQIGLHFSSILLAIVIFAITMLVPWSYYEGDGSNEGLAHHWPTACLWVLAVVVEQTGTSVGAVFMKLPFPAIYAGSRMQAWLMLCFGESVIGLLIEPIFFDLTQFGSIVAAFFMILALCTTYFDIVNADQFLHLFTVRKEKYKAFAYMNFQLPFSFSVFMGGVGLKNIMYISNQIHELETVSGCSRRLLEFPTYDLIPDEGRRLALSTFSVMELDDLLFRSFQLMTFSFSATMVSSILIGYGMPIELPYWQVHISRIGCMLLSLLSCIIPYHLKSIATPCLLDADLNDDGGSVEDATGYDTGLGLVQALVTTSLIMVISFFVALGSLDPNREDTYTKLEVEAHYERTKKALTKRAMSSPNMIVGMYKNTVAGITQGLDQITDTFHRTRNQGDHSEDNSVASSRIYMTRKNVNKKSSNNNKAASSKKAVSPNRSGSKYKKSPLSVASPTSPGSISLDL